MSIEELHAEIQTALAVHQTTDVNAALAEVVSRLRIYFSALRSGDSDLAEYLLSYLRSAVEPDRIEAAPRGAGERWWHPLSTRMCVLLAGLAAIGLSASVTAVAMRLRAQDAEVQLRTCQTTEAR